MKLPFHQIILQINENQSSLCHNSWERAIDDIR